MNKVIICEGATDGVFLQYYMEKVNGWQYSKSPSPLKHRRANMTKDDKFDVYFSIRTAADQFTERQNILKNIPWEQYTHIQTVFQHLSEL